MWSVCVPWMLVGGSGCIEVIHWSWTRLVSEWGGVVRRVNMLFGGEGVWSGEMFRSPRMRIRQLV